LRQTRLNAYRVGVPAKVGLAARANERLVDIVKRASAANCNRIRGTSQNCG